MVKVVWTPSARQDVESIFHYYDKLSHRVAKALVIELLDAARRLQLMPEMGPKEPILEFLHRSHHYVLVTHHYKLIYLYDRQICSILMVWDCRQNPSLMEQSDRFEH